MSLFITQSHSSSEHIISDDIYGDQTFSINIGSENDLKGKVCDTI